MAKGKTKFQFNVAGHESEAILLIRQFAQAQDYKTEAGSAVFTKGDSIVTAKRGFEYIVEGDVLSFFAYIGTSASPHQLQKFYGWAVSSSMMKEFKPLFDALTRLPYSQGTVASEGTQASTAAPDFVQPVTLDTVAIDADKDKKNGKFAIASLIISIVFFFLTVFLGIVQGWILIILNYWMAVQGRKSSKKGIATAAIVINSIDIVLGVISLILAFVL